MKRSYGNQIGGLTNYYRALIVGFFAICGSNALNASLISFNSTDFIDDNASSEQLEKYKSQILDCTAVQVINTWVTGQAENTSSELYKLNWNFTKLSFASYIALNDRLKADQSISTTNINPENIVSDAMLKFGQRFEANKSKQTDKFVSCLFWARINATHLEQQLFSQSDASSKQIIKPDHLELFEPMYGEFKGLIESLAQDYEANVINYWVTNNKPTLSDLINTFPSKIDHNSGEH